MPERVIKAAADVFPLDAFGGKATREHRIRVRSQRSERLQFPAWHQRLVLQAGDFVPYQQLATLQLHDLEMVDRRMRAGFDYFRF
jgi:hypothetical protein